MRRALPFFLAMAALGGADPAQLNVDVNVKPDDVPPDSGPPVRRSGGGGWSGLEIIRNSRKRRRQAQTHRGKRNK